MHYNNNMKEERTRRRTQNYNSSFNKSDDYYEDTRQQYFKQMKRIDYLRILRLNDFSEEVLKITSILMRKISDTAAIEDMDTIDYLYRFLDHYLNEPVQVRYFDETDLQKKGAYRTDLVTSNFDEWRDNELSEFERKLILLANYYWYTDAGEEASHFKYKTKLEFLRRQLKRKN